MHFLQNSAVSKCHLLTCYTSNLALAFSVSYQILSLFHFLSPQFLSCSSTFLGSIIAIARRLKNLFFCRSQISGICIMLNLPAESLKNLLFYLRQLENWNGKKVLWSSHVMLLVNNVYILARGHIHCFKLKSNPVGKIFSQ